VINKLDGGIGNGKIERLEAHHRWGFSMAVGGAINYPLSLTYSPFQLYQKQVTKPLHDFMQRLATMLGGIQKQEHVLIPVEGRSLKPY
jgi:hypothetical protein